MAANERVVTYRIERWADGGGGGAGKPKTKTTSTTVTGSVVDWFKNETWKSLHGNDWDTCVILNVVEDPATVVSVSIT